MCPDTKTTFLQPEFGTKVSKAVFRGIHGQFQAGDTVKVGSTCQLALFGIGWDKLHSSQNWTSMHLTSWLGER